MAHQVSSACPESFRFKWMLLYLSLPSLFFDRWTTKSCTIWQQRFLYLQTRLTLLHTKTHNSAPSSFSFWKTLLKLIQHNEHNVCGGKSLWLSLPPRTFSTWRCISQLILRDDSSHISRREPNFINGKTWKTASLKLICSTDIFLYFSMNLWSNCLFNLAFFPRMLWGSGSVPEVPARLRLQVLVCSS